MAKAKMEEQWWHTVMLPSFLANALGDKSVSPASLHPFYCKETLERQEEEIRQASPIAEFKERMKASGQKYYEETK